MGQKFKIKRTNILIGVFLACTIAFTLWLASKVTSLSIDWSFAIPCVTLIGAITSATKTVIHWWSDALERQRVELEGQIEEKTEEIERLQQGLSLLTKQVAASQEEIQIFRRILYKIEARMEVKCNPASEKPDML